MHKRSLDWLNDVCSAFYNTVFLLIYEKWWISLDNRNMECFRTHLTTANQIAFIKLLNWRKLRFLLTASTSMCMLKSLLLVICQLTSVVLRGPPSSAVSAVQSFYGQVCLLGPPWLHHVAICFMGVMCYCRMKVGLQVIPNRELQCRRLFCYN